MSLLIELAIIAAFFSPLFIVPVGLGLWAGLGNSNPFVRVLVLLGGIVAMGFFFRPSRSSDEFLIGIILFGFSLICIGTFWLMPGRKSKFTLAAILIALFWKQPNFIDLRPTGIIHIGVGIVAIAALACIYRLNGFRVLRLTRDCSDLELEIGTGRTLDEWIDNLHQQNAEKLTRVQIVELLRQEGVLFSWQRVLVDAYECVIGRSMVGQDECGRPQTVSGNANVRIRDLLNFRDGRYRWTIRQLMFLSFAVAAIAALLSRLGISADPIELIIVVLWSLGLGTIGLVIIHTSLKVNRSRKNLAAVVLSLIGSTAVTGVSFFIHSPMRLPIAASELWIAIFSWSLCFALYFTLAVFYIRNRGYRLMLIGRGRIEPAADLSSEPQSCVSRRVHELSRVTLINTDTKTVFIRVYLCSFVVLSFCGFRAWRPLGSKKNGSKIGSKTPEILACRDCSAND